MLLNSLGLNIAISEVCETTGRTFKNKNKKIKSLLLLFFNYAELTAKNLSNFRDF